MELNKVKLSKKLAYDRGKKSENELSPQSSSHRINTSIGDNLPKTVKKRKRCKTGATI